MMYSHCFITTFHALPNGSTSFSLLSACQSPPVGLRTAWKEAVATSAATTSKASRDSVEIFVFWPFRNRTMLSTRVSLDSKLSCFIEAMAVSWSVIESLVKAPARIKSFSISLCSQTSSAVKPCIVTF
ncbi:hypothetical protein GQ457_09G029940 [Hibiscus cannabinus]